MTEPTFFKGTTFEKPKEPEPEAEPVIEAPSIDIITSIKAVKNSVFVRSGDFYICRHYETDILTVLQLVPKYQIIKVNWYSNTSSKMIYRCLDYLGCKLTRKEIDKAISQKGYCEF